ncbi:MarR family winged helix-turn-helix transcriptional regulator [Nocardia sp. NBC_00403]|uniref:MarR family winged helix-turn-helix transcriptional regulator n=1 Tax=Nocardia sp. NBC_00403 TaxID=2975990 RepID=UPI003FA5936B
MKDLSARLGADVSNTAATVDRLESQGLVRKEPHPTDRRARIVTLTATATAYSANSNQSAFGKVPPLETFDPRQRHELYAYRSAQPRPDRHRPDGNDRRMWHSAASGLGRERQLRGAIDRRYSGFSLLVPSK